MWAGTVQGRHGAQTSLGPADVRKRAFSTNLWCDVVGRIREKGLERRRELRFEAWVTSKMAKCITKKMHP